MAVSRDFQSETTLCKAVAGRFEVNLHYKSDAAARTFRPHIVHQSKKTQKWLVEGVMTKNPNKPSDAPDWRAYEIGLIRSLAVTDNVFQPNRDFSSFGDDYWNVRCAVDRP